MQVATPSLRYDLDGCSLPPKIEGDERGAVLLSVPRILPSAAAEAAAERGLGPEPSLPSTTVVRTRWWGEDKPGSLFRPTLVSNDAMARERHHRAVVARDGERAVDAQSSVVLRFPVSVPAPQLLDYFRDMKTLQLDVINRATRKTYGKCRLPLAIERMDDEEESAEACLERLARQTSSGLLEIRSTQDPSRVIWPLSYDSSGTSKRRPLR
ncbi:hypothetical protein ATCC90586_009032 [Pythium insidiosum]|nr:hypothetical protein ATCC90586_009032 [Pythium insidiosum]